MEKEANKSGNNWLPLPCVIVALLILGFNEFMTLLKNPLYLILIFIGYLVTKSLWVQHDVAGNFHHGAVSISRMTLAGLLSLSIKLLPTIINLMRKLAEEGVPQTNNPWPYPSTSNQTAGSTVSSTTSSNVTFLERGTEYTASSKEE
ncbi:hypothetical protein AHAS_Ahas02G0176100 [Arachis hypogaea]